MVFDPSVIALTLLVRNSTTNILAKYKDAAPSLIIHLHPTHFRFDQQVYHPLKPVLTPKDGVFSYNSPMKVNIFIDVTYNRLSWNTYEMNKYHMKWRISSK
jgi:hypothetical protein